MSSFRQILVSILFLLSVTSIRCNDDANSTTSPTPTQTEEEFYTAADSASWAITSNRLSPILGTGKQSLYDDFIDGCDVAMFAYQNKKHLDRTKQEIHPTLNVPRCARDDEFRLRMNRDQPASVYNYTKMGYAKIRTPPALFKLIQDFWTKNKHKAEVEWKDINVYHNSWEAPPTIAYLNQIRSGGSSELQDMIWKEAKPILEEWTGQYLSPVSLYGIRSYHNGSILAPHVDRMPLVTSAIIQVDQDVDEPWPLEVYGHDGKATNVTMEPGDMVLYESHSVIHGRPFPMKGNFYANCFIHFEPYAPKEGKSNYDPELDIPPYLIAESAWHRHWSGENPRGWKKGTDIRDLMRKGDIPKILESIRSNPTLIHEEDALKWTVLHEAIRAGNKEQVEIFLQHGADKDHLTLNGESPLFLARYFLNDDHEVVKLLESVGATAIRTHENDEL